MSGSEAEPVAPDQADTQMQEATDRLRDKAWMVAPMTSGAAVVASQAQEAAAAAMPSQAALPSQEAPEEVDS